MSRLLENNYKFLSAHSFSPNKRFSKITNSISTEETVKHTNNSFASPCVDYLHEDISKELVNSQRNHQECPLSEVASLIPKEIPPSESIESSNPSINYYFDKAFLTSEQGDFLTAIKLYKKVLSTDPDHYESLINMGVCFMKIKQIPEAISCFDNAIKINKNSFMPFYNKALTYLHAKEYSLALECMNDTLKVFPELPDELLKIRTYSIFKGGKITSLITDNEDKQLYTNRENNTNISRATSSKTPTPSTITPRRNFKNVKKNEIFNIFPSPDKIINIKEDRIKIKKTILSPVIIRSKKTLPMNSFSPDTKKRNPKVLSIIPKFDKKPSYELNEFFKESCKKYLLNKEKLTDLKEGNQKGFFQKDLNVKENILNDHQALIKIKEEIEKLKETVEEALQRDINKTIECNPIIYDTHYTTEDQLRYLIDEFDKSSDTRNYKKIDKYFSVFDFFQKYDKNLRIQIYKISKICDYYKDQIIFRQGDKGDQLYIIIKGSITIVKKSDEFRGYSLVVNSLYDGKHFGDLALMNGLKSSPFTERTATCIASEHSYLLSVPKQEYQGLLLELHLKSIETKTQFLVQVPLFHGISPTYLIPLACNIEKKSFFLNDVIIKKGEVPSGLHVVVSGNIVLYTQGYIAREIHGSEYANIKIRKPEPDLFVGANFSGVRVKKPFKKNYFVICFCCN